MPSEPYPIRPLVDADFDQVFTLHEAAFNQTPRPHEEREVDRELLDPTRGFGAFDGDLLVGAAASLPLRMRVPGGVQPVAGVTAVAVLPSHRRRGVLRTLMTRQLPDLRERGEPVAALFASEGAIYGRFGYGWAASSAAIELHRGEGSFVPASPDTSGLRLRWVEPAAATRELAAVFDAASQRPGLFARDDAWWRYRVLDPEVDRGGASPLRCVIAEDGQGVRGYALFAATQSWDAYDLPQGTLRLRELCALDPAAHAALWRQLLDHDLVSRVTGSVPLDDPLFHLLAEPRRARAGVGDNLWVRLVDVPAALARRAYAHPVDVVLQVSDEVCPWNAGRYRLHADGGEGAATCEPASAAADVELPVSALGAAYLGGTRLASLARAGLVRELRPGTVRALSDALAWEPQPWCPMGF